MQVPLTRFRIESLHNQRNIDITMKDNKLVLVGENGLGKSTVANFIFYFLTSQWQRMMPYTFSRVTAYFVDEEISISKEDLQRFRPATPKSRTAQSAMQRRVNAAIDSLLASGTLVSPSDLVHDISTMRALAMAFDVPLSILSDYLHHFDFDVEAYGQMKVANEKLRSLVDVQVLYLPTYRRIERDLASIFPEISEELRRSVEHRVGRSSPRAYVELVEFGMHDVQRTFDERMAALKDKVRNDLNDLTGTYLRDVIRGDYKEVDPKLIYQLSDVDIGAIFSRMDEAILPAAEQSRLRDIIAQIKHSKAIDSEQRVVAHFLTRLGELYRTQQTRERDIREFVRVCNSYLRGKVVVYDNVNFSMAIHPDGGIASETVSNDATELALQMLSSGEKQIVSLFSHIYLSENSGYFVIIDEPELSLSVLWQKRFLPDILQSERCQGLVAVTHSPFIFENELDAYTRSLEDFVEPIHVVR